MQKVFPENLNYFQRYQRQIALREIGTEGQVRIGKSSVLLVGAGGLGSPVALYLCAAGVGTIGIADYDDVEISNLQRQIIHNSNDILKRKVISAKEKINVLNPEVKVKTYDCKIESSNIREMIDEYDFIVCATDNMKSKYLINDFCVKNHKAFSFGGVSDFSGQTFTYLPGHACLRCIFGDISDIENYKTSKAILGAVAGIMGSIQATEAIKYIIGNTSLLTDRLLLLDAIKMSFTEIGFSVNPHCSAGHDK